MVYAVIRPHILEGAISCFSTICPREADAGHKTGLYRAWKISFPYAVF